MQYYQFLAYDSQGKFQKGKILGESELSVIEYLKSYGLTIVKINQDKSINILRGILRFLTIISLKDKIFLYRNLVLILKSGANLTHGLRVLVRSLKYSALKELILFMIYHIEKGGRIYEVFQYYEKSFNPIEIEIIKVGEISGNLIKSFDKLAQDLDREKQVKSEIISSLIYPTIILGASLVVIILVTTFVIPRLANLVSQMETELPFYSMLILNIGLFIGNNIKIILAFLGLTFLIFILLILSKTGKFFLLKISLKIPIIKNIILTLNLRSFCFILESLLKSGIPLSRAIHLTSYVLNHPEIKSATLRIKNKIEQGENFSEIINQEEVFPKFFGGIISIASETGNIVEVLNILQAYYEDEFKFYIKNLMTLIEPILIIFVGLIVGLIAVSIVIPIYQQISTQIEKGIQQKP
ncbi:MAG: type II secretion system F family protein [Patescibacteria group bacterium]|nr:type II secretion system F family protein [Patescibacteria group bacterium]